MLTQALGLSTRNVADAFGTILASSMSEEAG
jgi:hypothetical protein